MTTMRRPLTPVTNSRLPTSPLIKSSVSSPSAPQQQPKTPLPLRAIPSTLAVKSSPSVPPASAAYEPLIKAVLRQRLLWRIFLGSIAFCWVQTVAWTIWCLGGIEELGIGGVAMVPVTPSTSMMAYVCWVAVALPIVVLRKRHLTGYHSTSKTPLKTLQNALAKQGTRSAFLVYLSSAIIATLLHVSMARMSKSNDPRLSVFVKSKKHPYYLNGRLVFLLTSQVIVACCSILRNIMMDRFVFRWPSSFNQTPKSAVTLGDFLRTLVIVALLASVSVPTSAAIFAIARLTLPMLYRLPLLHLVLRPFTAHFLRGSWTIFLPIQHFALLIRAWFLAFSTLATWEVAELLFDSFISQPILVSHMTADPSVTLVSGVASSDIILKYFAFAELNELSSDLSPSAGARRTALFGDQKYSPNLWSHLCRESLLVLGRDYQHFLRRGAPPTIPPPLAVATAAQPQPPPFLSTPVSVVKQLIYKQAKPSPISSVIDSLGADGSFAQAVEAGAEAAHIPDLFKSASTALPVPTEVTKSVEEAKDYFGNIRKSLGSAIHRYTPVAVQEAFGAWVNWWTRERISKVVEGSLSRRELDLLVIEVLSRLTCSSLTEDRYGVVQRDIPKILEAMLSFLSAIEDYQIELNALRPPPPEEEEGLSDKERMQREVLRIELAKASEALGYLGDGFKNGIARVVRTFGGKLNAFKFPPRTANKLQGFVDYNQ
ncbi:nucleoporin protein Ndc1-Nup [Desarmillaria tabescens]|uniref:Nucleoporin protein Ndc1-Nup n=1 Tax=Armillaria tabescens TaxID=1929756 RepID=A0AA39MQJ5_ARMTA|nr:nucleoporin protein Ndc1-Nup [Desarmillaria tabescens]KAK0443401.1 nucleoporin protein Ndc1-Nup [Desarmillaria tabescens]